MVPRLLLVVALGATPLLAQGDFDLDKTSPGTIGQSLDLAFDGAPGSTFFLLMVSFTGGPTPIATFFPSDPRSVQVGTDLSSAWVGGLTSPNGGGTFSMALPNTPLIEDLVFHWQAATLATGGPSPVGQISNDVVTQLGLPRTGLPAHGALLAARGLGTGFFDRDNNNGAGDFVVAGGGSGSLTSATGLQTSEVWDFRRMTVQAGPTLTVARAAHTAVVLNDGRVLLAGGVDQTGAVLASCELYDPAANSFSATGSLGAPRVLHAACRLADGRVMVAGGTSDLTDVLTAATNTTNSVEIYDPTSGTWSGAAAIGGRRMAPALTLLASGQVMVSGGVQFGYLFGIPISAMSVNTVQRWNPSTNAWSSGPNMNHARAGHHYSQVTLSTGEVLFSGGIFVPNLAGAANATPIAGAEVFDGASWTVAGSGMPYASALHSATELPSGLVAVCGGAFGTFTTPVPTDAAALFDPVANTWTSLPPLSEPRSGHAAAVMPDGTLVLFGGQGATGTLSSLETLRF